MGMIDIISRLIKKNNTLYEISKICYNFIYDSNFRKLIKCYCVCSKESIRIAPLLIEHLGDNYPDKIVYWIDYANITILNHSNIKRSYGGMYANIRRILELLNFADILGLEPVVNFGKYSAYYDKEMDPITTNVFEYYFLPTSEINNDDVTNCYNVIKYRPGHSNFYMEHGCDKDSYKITDGEIERLGYIYKKYIHLNKTTEEYIKQEISKILGKKRTLGLHIRGTDYKLKLKNHPNIVRNEEYINLAKELLANKNYEQIFIATDDLEILSIFQNEFGDKLVYYNDTFRTSGDVSSHSSYDNRPLHYYKLGLEVIRDVYTLASCDSLICGLSQVAFAARYVNISMDRKYEDLRIIDHGINQ